MYTQIFSGDFYFREEHGWIRVFGRVHTKRYLCKLIMPVRRKVIEANTIDYTSFKSWEKYFDPEEWIVKIQISLPLKTEKLYTLEQYEENQTEGALRLVKYFLKFKNYTDGLISLITQDVGLRIFAYK